MLLFRLDWKGPPDYSCNYYCENDSEEGAHGCLLCLLARAVRSRILKSVVARCSHRCAGHHKNNGLQDNEAIREYKVPGRSAFGGKAHVDFLGRRTHEILIDGRKPPRLEIRYRLLACR